MASNYTTVSTPDKSGLEEPSFSFDVTISEAYLIDTLENLSK
jgi:hypothetical protein